MPSLLPIALRANAAFSGLSGIAMTLAAVPIGRFLGLEPWFVATIGTGLVGFAIGVAFVSRDPSAGWTAAIIGADAVWVVASLSLLVAFPTSVSGAGRVAVVVVALIVADLALLQTVGARSMRAST